MEFQLRDKIDNQYRVTEKHYGGMSVVYIVLDEFSQKRFAVKTIKEELLEDRSAVSRFATEARTWMNLGRHPNIVEAIIYREIEGQPFLFLEYIEGSDLQRLIEADKTIFPPQLVDFMLQVTAGMSYVHSATVGPGNIGVIHRDIKPANIMLTREAVVKITDFGLAKAYGLPTVHTDVGIGLGTYFYMPPEQLLDASSADRTSDIYSFGVAFYVAATGRPPIQGKSIGQVVRNIISQEPVGPGQLVGGIPRELEEVIMRCLAKSREERYQSFDEVRSALQSIAEVVSDAHSGRDDVRVCRGCGYLTTRTHRGCPICANSLQSTSYPLPQTPTEVAPTVSETAAESALEQEPEALAAAELLETARRWQAQGELSRAQNVLRQALSICPGHTQVRQALDEVSLLVARQRPRPAGKAYNWPMFRGNITRTGYTPEAVDPPLSRKWQYRVGDWVLASPAVANGVVYVGGRMNRPGWQGHFVALQAANGQLVWEMDFPHEVLLSPCVLAGNLIFVACHNGLYALDSRTGKKLWDHGAGTAITASPVAWQNAVYFGTEDGTFCAMHAQSGQLIWSFRAEMGIYSSALIWENMVYFGSMDHRLYAVDQNTGRLRWEFMSANEVSATPIFHRGRIYVASHDYRLYCLDQASGRRVWEFPTAGAINSSPAASQDTIYVGSRDRSLYAIEAESGRRKWHFQAGDWVDSSPAISGHTIYCGCHDKKLYALHTETGVVLWEYEAEGEIASSPAVSAGRVLVGSNDGNVYCFKSR